MKELFQNSVTDTGGRASMLQSPWFWRQRENQVKVCLHEATKADN